MKAPAGPLIVRRPCPGCGAPVRHAEGDGTAACGHCGLRLVVPPHPHGMPAFLLMRPAQEAELLVNAKRALREAGIRLRRILSPRRFHSPFYRLRAETWLCYREPCAEPRPEAPRHVAVFGSPQAARATRWLEVAPRLPASPAERTALVTDGCARETIASTEEPPMGEVRFQAGARDLTIEADAGVDLGPYTLGVRVQACEALPLAEAGAVEILPARLDAAEARTRLLAALHAAATRETAGADQRLFAPETAWMLLYAPQYAVAFEGNGGRRAVILDGISLRPSAILSPEEFGRLESLLRTIGENSDPTRDPSEISRDPRLAALLPLTCPECSAPLPLLPTARVHACPICLRLWSVAGDRLEAVSWRRLRAEAPGHRAPQESAEAWLPFHRLHGGTEELLAPAFQGRHPRAVWNFALAACRRRPRWIEDGESGPPGAVVERRPETATALAPFIRYCLERSEPADEVAGDLVWLGFVARGPDWVEPGLGLGFPRAAVTPWAPFAGSGPAAAHRG